MNGNRTGHNTGLMPIGILSAGGVRSTALDRYIDKGCERANRQGRTNFNLARLAVVSGGIIRLESERCRLAKTRKGSDLVGRTK